MAYYVILFLTKFLTKFKNFSILQQADLVFFKLLPLCFCDSMKCTFGQFWNNYIAYHYGMPVQLQMAFKSSTNPKIVCFMQKYLINIQIG